MAGKVFFWGGIAILGGAIAFGAHTEPLFKFWVPLPCLLIVLGLWLTYKGR